MKHLNLYTDADLIALISRDDEKAFEMLFDRHWESAHTIATAKLKSKEVAQEIVDDLFLDLWHRRKSLRIDNFSNYLRVAIKYKVISHIRHQLSKERYLTEHKHAQEAQECAAMQSVEYDDLRRALEEAMKTLPGKTQEVFRLSRMEGYTVSDIASELNLSEKAIEYHITRFRKGLRLYLKDFLVLVVGVMWM